MAQFQWFTVEGSRTMYNYPFFSCFISWTTLEYPKSLHVCRYHKLYLYSALGKPPCRGRGRSRMPPARRLDSIELALGRALQREPEPQCPPGHDKLKLSERSDGKWTRSSNTRYSYTNSVSFRLPSVIITLPSCFFPTPVFFFFEGIFSLHFFFILPPFRTS